MNTKEPRKCYENIFIVALLVISLFQGVMAADTVAETKNSLLEAPVNPEYLNYDLTVKESKKDAESVFLGVIPDPVDTSHLKGKRSPKST
jgi:hypothetical protein